MTLYKGPALKKFGDGLIHIRGSTTVVQENWLRGSLLTVASCITWSIWYIMQVFIKIKINQKHSSKHIILFENLAIESYLFFFLIFLKAYTLKRYPAQLSLTTWMNLVGAAQSAVYTVIVQHRRSAWTIGFNIDLWSTLYGVRAHKFENIHD